MRRYLAFAGDDEPRVIDFKGDYDDLPVAKAAVDVREPDGFPVHLRGVVIDTQTGNTLSWECDGTQFGGDQWRIRGVLLPR